MFLICILGLKKLGSIPQSVFWAAIDSLGEKESTNEQRSFLRRLALIALCGGIPVDLLDCLKNFTFQSRHFTSLPLPIGNLALDDGLQCNLEKTKENFSYLKEQLEGDVKLLEAGIRGLFWDSLLIDSFRDLSAPWSVHPELVLDLLLNLDVGRRTDIAVFLKKFSNIILFCEISKDKFSKNVHHKDFSKLSSTLAISCIRLAEFLKSKNCDPSKARTFGILVGGSCFQLAVAHPVFTPIAGTQKHEIRIDISVNPHWFCDFDDPVRYSLTCSGPCCIQEDLNPLMQSETLIIPKYSKSEESKNFLLQANWIAEAAKSKDFEANISVASDDDEKEYEEVHDHVGDVMAADADETMPRNVSTTELIETEVFNHHALAKYSIFVIAVKKYMRELIKFEKVDDVSRIPDFDCPNLAYVPVASRENEKETPKKQQLRGALQMFQPNDSPLNNSRMNRKSQGELNIYSKYLNSFICFPKMVSSWKEDDGTVAIKFERMHHLVGNGIFGPYGNGKLFGPMIRSGSPLELIIDACTFAVHSLYGLHVLHDLIGYVHGDISPENIMFSTKDEMWKLNDFESAMSIDQSLRTVRKSCGTENFISPESLKTGIFTKSSDLYSLGSILWRIFHIQIMWLACLDEQPDNIQRAYDEFFECVTSMIKESPSDRPSVINSMSSFHKIIKSNRIKEFKVYSSDKLMVTVEKLIDQYQYETDETDIKFQEIASENLM